MYDELPITEVVSGGARGADAFGEVWAKDIGLPITVFRAEWDRLGKMAGFVRNEEMADYADALIAFPGGRGTAHMIRRATHHGLKVFVVPDRNGGFWP